MKKIKLKSFSRVQLYGGLFFVVIFTIIGIHLLTASHAASPYIASQAESGTLTSGATTKTDSTSGATYVTFGQSASSNSIYLSPASGSAAINSNLVETLHINPGTPADTIQAQVNFDSTKLQFVSATFGSTFTQFINTSSTGSITLVGYIPGASTSSDTSVATLTFKALVDTGSTSITVGSDNAAFDGSYLNPINQPATISFTP